MSFFSGAGAGGTAESASRGSGASNVVGFLARSRDLLLLPHKIGRWRKEPLPAAVCELVQCLLRLGRVPEAWQYAREGLVRFKDHDLVREMHRIAGRAHAEVGLKTARIEIKDRPSANAFLRLARCAVLLRDLEAAFKALEECTSRFPTSATAHAALAELLEQRWVRDLAAADGRLVVAHLKKAWRLDGAEAARPLRLATFLNRIGAPRSALAVVEEVLQLHPEATQAEVLRGTLEPIVAAELASESFDPEQQDDIELLLRQVEEQGRMTGDPGDVTRIARETDKLRTYLPALRRKAGCEHALVIEPKGGAWDENGPLPATPLTGLAANLAHSAHRATRRADLGPLVSATLETAGGSLLLQRVQRCTVAMLIDEPGDVDAGHAALTALSEGRLASAEGNRR